MSYDHTQLTHTSQTAPIQEYRVMWTTQKKQKLKKWHDGTLRFHTFNNRMLLYDEARSLVTDKYLKPGTSIDEGDELGFEQHLVTVEEFLQTVIQDLAPVFAPAMQRARKRAVQNGMSPVRTPAQRMGAQAQTPMSRGAAPTPMRPTYGGGPQQHMQTPIRQQQRPQTPQAHPQQVPQTQPRSRVDMGPSPQQWRPVQSPAVTPAPAHRTSAPLPPLNPPPQRQYSGPPIRNPPPRSPEAPVSRPPPPSPPPPELYVRASPEIEPPPRPNPLPRPQFSSALARQLPPQPQHRSSTQSRPPHPQSRPPPYQEAPFQPAASLQQHQRSPPLFRLPPHGLQNAPQHRSPQTPCQQPPQPPSPPPLQFTGLAQPTRQRPARLQPPPPPAQAPPIQLPQQAQPTKPPLRADEGPKLRQPRTPEPGILRLSDPHKKRNKMLAPPPPPQKEVQKEAQRLSPPKPQPQPRKQRPSLPARLQPEPEPEPQPQEQEEPSPGVPAPQKQDQPPKLKPRAKKRPPPPPPDSPLPQSKPQSKPQQKPPARSEPSPKRARLTATTPITIDLNFDSDPFSPMATPIEKMHEKPIPIGKCPREERETLAQRQTERKDYDETGAWSREARDLFEWKPW